MRNDEYNNVNIDNHRGQWTSAEFGNTQKHESTSYSDNKIDISDELNDQGHSNDENSQQQQSTGTNNSSKNNKLNENDLKNGESSEASSSAAGSESVSTSVSTAGTAAASTATASATAVGAITGAVVIAIPTIIATVALTTKISYHEFYTEPYEIDYIVEVTKDENDDRLFGIYLGSGDMLHYYAYGLTAGQNSGTFYDLMPSTDYVVTVMAYSLESSDTNADTPRELLPTGRVLGEDMTEVEEMPSGEILLQETVTTAEEPVYRTSMQIRTPASQLQFYVGDTFTYSGLEVEATLNKGDPELLDVNEYAVIFDEEEMNTAGTKTVTISYRGTDVYLSDITYDITVEQVVKTAMQIRKPANKLEFYVGETFTYEGLEVEAIMNHGDPVLLSETEYSVNVDERDMAASGTTTVTISYLGSDAVLPDITYDITITDLPTKELTGISITSPADKTVYYLGESLDMTGLEVTATYTNEEFYPAEIISSDDLDFTFDFSQVGDTTVTVYYGGMSASYDVTVLSHIDYSFSGVINFTNGNGSVVISDFHGDQTLDYVNIVFDKGTEDEIAFRVSLIQEDIPGTFSFNTNEPLDDGGGSGTTNPSGAVHNVNVMRAGGDETGASTKTFDYTKTNRTVCLCYRFVDDTEDYYTDVSNVTLVNSQVVASFTLDETMDTSAGTTYMGTLCNKFHIYSDDLTRVSGAEFLLTGATADTADISYRYIVNQYTSDGVGLVDLYNECVSDEAPIADLLMSNIFKVSFTYTDTLLEETITIDSGEVQFTDSPITQADYYQDGYYYELDDNIGIQIQFTLTGFDTDGINGSTMKFSLWDAAVTDTPQKIYSEVEFPTSSDAVMFLFPESEISAASINLNNIFYSIEFQYYGRTFYVVEETEGDFSLNTTPPESY